MDEGVRQEQQAEQARDAWAEVESLREQLEAKAERLTTTQELYLAEQARAEAAEAKLAEVEKERDRLQEQLNAALDVGDRATDQRDRLRASTDRARELAEARLQGREFLSDKRTFEEIVRLLSGDEEQRPNPAHPDWFPPDGTRKAE